MTPALHHAGAGLTFVNARLMSGAISSLRIVGSRIVELGGLPGTDDRVVDLRGDRVLPGLINAHDHLQLNSLSRPETGRRYRHVREWISDVDSRRHLDPVFGSSVAMARDARLFIGGIKNLLSGATTVAHHDPLYPYLTAPGYPVRVVRHYGWAHSLYVDGKEQVARSYRGTPAQSPWVIHAAEGVDDDAAGEFELLEALGCLGANTVLVHGIALDASQRLRLRRASGGLIWCPSSNMNLFGRSADVADLSQHGRVALGTDSRLSGSRDLLDELCTAALVGGFGPAALAKMVTQDSARLLRLNDRGALLPDAPADILILPARTDLGSARRADVRLVLIHGIIRYGDIEVAQAISPNGEWADIRVDDVPKILDHLTAAALSRTAINEPGLELVDVSWRAA